MGGGPYVAGEFSNLNINADRNLSNETVPRLHFALKQLSTFQQQPLKSFMKQILKFTRLLGYTNTK